MDEGISLDEQPVDCRQKYLAPLKDVFRVDYEESIPCPSNPEMAPPLQ